MVGTVTGSARAVPGQCHCVAARHFCPCFHLPPHQQLELLVRLVPDLVFPQCCQPL